MNFREPKTLGRTGLKAGRLGVASSYGAPAEAYEEAFERGSITSIGAPSAGEAWQGPSAISSPGASGTP